MDAKLHAAELFSVSGRTALVTGGATGIGRMIAAALLANGARVVIASRKTTVCEQAAAELSEFGECTPATVDVTDGDSIRRLADSVQDAHQGLDILVNNSGTGWTAPLSEYPVNAWDKVFNTNVRAPFLLIQSLLPLLFEAARPDRPARIVNVGSLAGLHTHVGDNYAYGSSKAALHHLTRVLAGELAKRHVTVNAIAPGPFPGRMMSSDTLRELVDTVPLGRAGDAADAGGAVLYLCSRAGSFVTGTVIPVDGGRLLRM